jgi:hypothetical protein
MIGRMRITVPPAAVVLALTAGLAFAFSGPSMRECVADVTGTSAPHPATTGSHP